MKKFVLKFAVVFTFVFCLIFGFLILGEISIEQNLSAGPSTKEQIDFSFDKINNNKYDVVMFGNSRIYRGVNPSAFTNAFNFSNDAESYNQMYYKLLYAYEKNPHMKSVIIGTDYFQFSSFDYNRNYAYRKYLPKEYIDDFDYDLSMHYAEFLTSKIYPYRIMIKAWQKNGFKPLSKTKKTPYMRDNGQYLTFTKSSPSDRIKRDSTILDIQKNYFIKMIDFCKEKNIDYYVVMMPSRHRELKNYSQKVVEDFDVMIYETLGEKDQYRYLKYAGEKYKTYMSDTYYQDITHLTVTAADSFSELLSNDIANLQQLHSKVS